MGSLVESEENQAQINFNPIESVSEFIVNFDALFIEIKTTLMSNNHYNVDTYTLKEFITYYCSLQDMKFRNAKLASGLALLAIGSVLNGKSSDDPFSNWLKSN